jgi:membrane fusion protein (multidrug efflux system)
VQQIERVAVEHEYQDKADRARTAELGRQLIDLDAERRATEAAIATFQAQLTRRRVHAPVSGVVGNVAPISVGDILQPGQVIATIVPARDVRVVAFFAPGPALGRILPGQPARVRLDGFSWMEFGMLHATVANSANEPQRGLIRVELELQDADVSRIPMQHGLTGSVDIRIEEASPWTLLLRSIGARLTSDTGSPAQPALSAREPQP